MKLQAKVCCNLGLATSSNLHRQTLPRSPKTYCLAKENEVLPLEIQGLWSWLGLMSSFHASQSVYLW